jgi:hypothetical protein
MSGMRAACPLRISAAYDQETESAVAVAEVFKTMWFRNIETPNLGRADSITCERLRGGVFGTIPPTPDENTCVSYGKDFFSSCECQV